MVDACHSGTVLDLQKGGIWGGLKVFCLSGCQDDQFSGDTGNGGVMTHAMLKVLKSSAIKNKRMHRNASIQYIFNRMVEEMPEEEQPEEEEELMEENYEDLVFDFLDFEEEEGEFDDW